MVEVKPKAASAAPPKKTVSAAAALPRPPESGRSGKLDPVRYGDWEINGIATHF
jgi:hypothetical protein